MSQSATVKNALSAVPWLAERPCHSQLLSRRDEWYHAPLDQTASARAVHQELNRAGQRETYDIKYIHVVLVVWVVDK